MGRDVPWSDEDICDECGKKGAYDFMGDCFCAECSERLFAEQEKPMSGKIDPKDVEAPTHLDGTPVDKEEAARVHAGLVSGEMKIEATPEALADMEEAGISLEDIKEALIAASRKTMS